MIQECQRLKKLLEKERLQQGKAHKSVYDLKIMLSKLNFKQRSIILEEMASSGELNLERFDVQRKRLKKRIEEFQRELKEKVMTPAKVEEEEKRQLDRKRALIKKKVFSRIKKREKQFKSGYYFKYSAFPFKKYDYEGNKYRKIDYTLANPFLKDKELPEDEVVKNMLEEQKKKNELYSKQAIRRHTAKIDQLINDRKKRALT